MYSHQIDVSRGNSDETSDETVCVQCSVLLLIVQALLRVPEVRSKALLAGSSLVYQLCQRSQTPCTELPPIQTFMQTLEETLREGCEGEEPTRVREVKC